MSLPETIIVLDFGGQYNRLIARRVREANVYCEVHPHTIPMEKIKQLNPKGIIFTGGPNDVNDPESPTCGREILDLGVPILGICYGAQLIAKLLGGKVDLAQVPEFGGTQTFINHGTRSGLFRGVDDSFSCWMSHNCLITRAPDNFTVSAFTKNCPIAAMENPELKIYATQFHPEVAHTGFGFEIIKNFALNVCACKGDWSMAPFAESSISELKDKIGNDRVLLALSGGVDSAVCCAMLAKAIGKQLTCVFVDHGLMRKNEADEVEEVFCDKKKFDIDFIRVDASELFYDKLAGVTDPESKRKIIGARFLEVFRQNAERLKKQYGQIKYFAQGTIYPDVIESGAGKSATIKSHHNVGGLPAELGFEQVIEPLRMLFKDEVRQLGIQLGLPPSVVYRQPFPGPGLGIRIIGAITPDKVRMVQDADAIYREIIDNSPYKNSIGQYYAAFPDVRTVGVMGDERTYQYAILLRAVDTSDFMTANATRLPWDLLETAANRIVNEVKGVNRVFYDCTSKPPATIELE